MIFDARKAGPAPPGILRACARLSRMDGPQGLALADEMMFSNPDFVSCPLALANLKVSLPKVDIALRVAFFLELCHRELTGKPLPLFPPDEVLRHHRKTVQHFRTLAGKHPSHANLQATFFRKKQPQIHVTSWILKLLTDSGIILVQHEEDIKAVTCTFTLLSLYFSAFPSKR